jgi:hypothetical protein
MHKEAAFSCAKQVKSLPFYWRSNRPDIKSIAVVPLKIQKGGCFFIACIYDKRMKENGLYKNHDSLNTRRISGK